MEILLFFGYWGLSFFLSLIAILFSKYWRTVTGLYVMLALIFAVMVISQSQRIDRIKPLIISLSAGKIAFEFRPAASANYSLDFYIKDGKKSLYSAFPNVVVDIKGSINHKAIEIENNTGFFLGEYSYSFQKGEKIPISLDYQFRLDRNAEKKAENLATLEKAINASWLLKISAEPANQSINLGLFSVEYWLNIPIIFSFLLTASYFFIHIRRGTESRWKIGTTLMLWHLATPFIIIQIVGGISSILDFFIRMF